MITVLLESKNDEVVGTAGKAENDRFLVQNDPTFPKLSLLSGCSCDVFAAADMPQLIHELKMLRRTIGEQNQAHIDEVIDLAVRCRDGEGMTLTFTPFE